MSNRFTTKALDNSAHADLVAVHKAVLAIDPEAITYWGDTESAPFIVITRRNGGFDARVQSEPDKLFADDVMSIQVGFDLRLVNWLDAANDFIATTPDLRIGDDPFVHPGWESVRRAEIVAAARYALRHDIVSLVCGAYGMAVSSGAFQSYVIN